MWRLFGMIFCGTFFSATSVEKLALYNLMNIAVNILHEWDLDIMIHFHNCEYFSYKQIRERRNESYRSESYSDP